MKIFQLVSPQDDMLFVYRDNAIAAAVRSAKLAGVIVNSEPIWRLQGSTMKLLNCSGDFCNVKVIEREVN